MTVMYPLEKHVNDRWFCIIWPMGIMGWDTRYVMKLEVHCFKLFYNFICIVARLASFHSFLLVMLPSLTFHEPNRLVNTTTSYLT
jgi:hypothetical protein